jgi:hypothetical protein
LFRCCVFRQRVLLFADWKGWSDSAFFSNNIFYNAGSARFPYGVSRAKNGAYTTSPGEGSSRGNVFDSNVYFGVVAPPQDPHREKEDPQFLAPGTGESGRLTLRGYDLAPASVARGNGIAIEKNGGRDFWGTPVPSCGHVDPGAVQSKDCSSTSR